MAVTGRKSCLAVYGNVAMVREFCESCGGMALVIDGLLACCDSVAVGNPERWKRMSEPEYRRDHPTGGGKLAILSFQENRCAYCEVHFGTWVRRNGKPIKLAVRWDHVVPWCFNANNADENFVAACQICNGIKADLIFDTIEAARVYIATKNDADRTPDSDL